MSEDLVSPQPFSTPPWLGGAPIQLPGSVNSAALEGGHVNFAQDGGRRWKRGSWKGENFGVEATQRVHLPKKKNQRDVFQIIGTPIGGFEKEPGFGSFK